MFGFFWIVFLFFDIFRLLDHFGVSVSVSVIIVPSFCCNQRCGRWYHVACTKVLIVFRNDALKRRFAISCDQSSVCVLNRFRKTTPFDQVLCQHADDVGLTDADTTTGNSGRSRTRIDPAQLFDLFVVLPGTFAHCPVQPRQLIVGCDKFFVHVVCDVLLADSGSVPCILKFH